MKNTLKIAALLAFLASPVAAQQQNGIGPIGVPPQPGFTVPDGNWLQGVANGVNASYVSGLTAAGTTQATATQIPAGKTLVEFDTVASNTGGYLPLALPGVEISIYNNGAQTLTLYPNINNNPNTNVQDTINNSTSFSNSSFTGTHTSAYCFCAKVGLWTCK